MWKMRWVGPVYPVEGEAEFVAQFGHDLDGDSALSVLILRPAVLRDVDPPAQVGRRYPQRFPRRFQPV